MFPPYYAIFFHFDKNSLLVGMNIRKTELLVNQKDPKIRTKVLGRIPGNDYQVKSFIMLKICQPTASGREVASLAPSLSEE